MKLKFCLMGMLCLFFQAKGQTTKYLNKGDKMPDVVITNIINNKMKSARISDFKGKLVILDFWQPWCDGCVEAFPKMDSLQRQFSGKLQIFLVNCADNHSNERAVWLSINRVEGFTGRKLSIPVVFSDTLLKSLFYFIGVPHYVWIDKQGTILAMTDLHQVTRENISRILEGKEVELKQKVERIRNIKKIATP